MILRYPVTTETRKCPYCHYVLKRKQYGHEIPLIACMWFITLPIMVSWYIIYRYGLGTPYIPKIGLETMICPNCSKTILTDKVLVKNLDKEDLITHRFKPLFIISYLLGAVFILFTLFALIEQAILPYLAIAFFSLAIVLTIVITYRYKVANCKIKYKPPKIKKRTKN